MRDTSHTEKAKPGKGRLNTVPSRLRGSWEWPGGYVKKLGFLATTQQKMENKKAEV